MGLIDRFTPSTATVEIDGSPKRPPVGEIWWNALGILVEHRRRLATALLLPGALQVYAVYFIEKEQRFEGIAGAVASDLMLSLVRAFFCVALLRVVLLGPDSTPWYGELFNLKRVLRFTGYFVVILLLGECTSLAMGLPLMHLIAHIAPAFLFLIPALMFVAKLYVALRFCLVLPSVAVDKELGFRDAWGLSRGRVGRMFRAFVVVPLLAALPLILALSGEGKLPLPDPESLAVKVGVTGGGFVILATFFYTVLALLFQETTGFRPEQETAPEDPFAQGPV